MKVAIYAEQCVRGGEVCLNKEKIEMGGDDPVVIYEVEVTEDELQQMAKELMKRPCGWTWRTGRSILEAITLEKKEMSRERKTRKGKDDDTTKNSRRARKSSI